MNAKSTRILKEARAIFWPWCAVLIVGGLALFQQQPRYIVFGSNVTEIGLIFCILVILLLPTLSFGSEFQHRTLPLLLTQPVNRMEIWGEKVMVAVAAVLSAALVVSYGWQTVFQHDPKPFVFFGALIITSVPSATYWTLLARSTLGGLVLSWMVPYAIGVAAWLNLPKRIQETGDLSSPAAIPMVATAVIALIIYSGVMLWLGRRALARFQVAGGMAGNDLLMAASEVMPEVLTGWLRCRPTEPLRNLVRREIRLLRSLWPLCAISVAAWIFNVTFQLIPQGPERPSNVAFFAFVITIFLGVVLVAILAGTLSQGEEKNWGTHAWHMTLPVSASTQWLMKLAVAVSASVLFAALLPMAVLLVGGWMRGSLWMYMSPKLLWVWPTEIALITLAAFWCSCVVKGTVRAALWLFPVMMGLFVAGRTGGWFAELIGSSGSGIVQTAVGWLDPIRFARLLQLYAGAFPEESVVAIMLAPMFAFALIQSHRLFREEAEESKLYVLRRLTPLLGLCLTGVFVFSLFVECAMEAWRQQDRILRETHAAIEELRPPANLPSEGLQLLTANDLEKAVPLSGPTRAWLRDSRIDVQAEPSVGNANVSRSRVAGGFLLLVKVAPGKAALPYSAVIRGTRGGRTCSLTFAPVAPAGFVVQRYGRLFASCE